MSVVVGWSTGRQLLPVVDSCFCVCLQVEAARKRVKKNYPDSHSNAILFFFAVTRNLRRPLPALTATFSEDRNRKKSSFFVQKHPLCHRLCFCFCAKSPRNPSRVPAGRRAVTLAVSLSSACFWRKKGPGSVAVVAGDSSRAEMFSSAELHPPTKGSEGSCD